MRRATTVAVFGHTGRGGYGHQLDQAFVGLPDVTIVAVADPDDAGRAEAQDRIGALRAYADYRTLLAEERPDIVVVAPRWPGEHRAMTLAALAAGAHVYCEKPLAISLAEADEIIEAADRYGRLLAHALPFVHESRAAYLLDPARLRELVGEVLEIDGLTKWDTRGGGEDFLILGLHFADMMRRMVGDARWCEASVRTQGGPARREGASSGDEPVGPVLGESIVATYGNDAGVPMRIRSHRAGITDRAKHPYRLEVRGTRGMLLLRAPYADHSVWYLPEPVFRPGVEGAWRRLPTQETPTYAQYHQRAARDLLDAVRTGRPPRCTGRDGLRALEMIHAAYVAHLAGARIPLPLTDRRHPLDGVQATATASAVTRDR